MHRQVIQSNQGKCLKCGMDLLPEGTRFAVLRHMLGHSVMVIVMLVVMAAAMAVFMLIR